MTFPIVEQPQNDMALTLRYRSISDASVGKHITPKHFHLFNSLIVAVQPYGLFMRITILKLS